MKKYLSKVLYVLTGTQKSLVLLLLIFSLTSFLEALGIGLIGPFLNLASKPETIHQISFLDWLYKQLGVRSSDQFIPVLGLFTIGVFCAKSLSYFLSKSYTARFSFNQRRLLVSRLLSTYLRVSYTLHLSRNTANLIKNITLETNRFTNACLLPLLNFVANFFILCGLLVLLAKTDLLLLAMILGILLPIALLFARLGGIFRKWGKIASQSQEDVIRTINHSLGGLKETRIIGCEAYFEEEIDQHSQRQARASTLFESSQFLPRILIETFLVIFLVLFISLAQLFLDREFENLISVMGVFAVAALRLIPASSQLMQGLGQLRNSSYALDMLYFDLKEIEKQELNEARKSSSQFRVDNAASTNDCESQTMTFTINISLENITYRYPGISQAAIKDLSLCINKGESIALIGKSGAGKTTLVDIILGLLQPESGNIQVDGISIYNNLRSWQNLVGYIPQSIFLMDDTVERNIAFGLPDHLIDSRRLEQAIKAAQLEYVVAQLPDGIKTGIGERGVRLSGGQRQRIGIARSLYHEREILVLDEATSALDNETEKLVSQAISSLAGSKTLIIIAHRLSTVEHCDCIYLMEKGQIIRSGSYQEVVLAT